MASIDVMRNGGPANNYEPSWIVEGTLQTGRDAAEIWWRNDIPLNSISRVTIRSEAFAAVAQAMMEINPDAAMKAFGVALQAGIPKAEQRLAAAS